MRTGIPLVIKNTMTDSPGTIISTPVVKRQPKQSHKPNRIITSIAHATGRTQINIETKNGIEEQNEILLRLADNNISIDIINIFPEKMVFTIDGNATEKALEVINTIAKPNQVIKNCSKISAVGERMRGVPGVMSRIIQAMRSKQIEVLQTSDSHSTISCLVKGEDTIPAVLALHEEFKLYQE